VRTPIVGSRPADHSDEPCEDEGRAEEHEDRSGKRAAHRVDTRETAAPREDDRGDRKRGTNTDQTARKTSYPSSWRFAKKGG